LLARRVRRSFFVGGVVVERDSLPESLTTLVLIEQVQAGDRGALDVLLDRYLMRVLAAVRIRLGAKLRQKVESWDIVQQVMLNVMGEVKAGDFRTDGAFLNYLNRVVENRIRDEADRWGAQRRDMNREVSVENPRSPGSTSPLDIVGAGASPTPSKVLILQEDLARLELAIDQLGNEADEYRELIVAVKIEGRSYAEMAEEQGTTPDAIRMKVQRAQAALTRIYKKLDLGS
jgi:RNA polymerase sigma factor (sigma-70 family)